jgi:hypothetical protein
MSSSERVQKQKDLHNLLNSLPNTAEFDPIANVIAEFSPKLAGSVTQAVLIDLQSRDATLKAASVLLTQVSNKADADARTLTFEKPRLVAAALTEALGKLGELRMAAQSGNIEEAAAQVETLLTLIQHVQGSIKVT